MVINFFDAKIERHPDAARPAPAASLAVSYDKAANRMKIEWDGNNFAVICGESPAQVAAFIRALKAIPENYFCKVIEHGPFID
jgi:hypothetical protein